MLSVRPSGPIPTLPALGRLTSGAAWQGPEPSVSLVGLIQGAPAGESEERGERGQESLPLGPGVSLESRSQLLGPSPHYSFWVPRAASFL